MAATISAKGVSVEACHRYCDVHPLAGHACTLRGMRAAMASRALGVVEVGGAALQRFVRATWNSARHGFCGICAEATAQTKPPRAETATACMNTSVNGLTSVDT